MQRVFHSEYFFLLLIILTIFGVTSNYLAAIASPEESIFVTYFGNDDGYPYTDFTYYFLPFYDSTSEAIMNGELPLWDSNRNVALFGNDLVAFPYFPYILGVFLSTLKVFMISTIFHLILGAFSIYFLSRYFRVSQLGSYIAAVIYALGGQATYFGATGHAEMLHGVAYLPLTLLFIFKLFESESAKKRRFYTVIIGLLFGIMFFIGAVTFIFNIVVALGLVFVYFLVPWIRKKEYSTIFHYIKYIIVIMILFALIAVPKFIAFTEFALVSDGHDVLGFSGIDLLKGSFHPLLLLQFLVLPNFFDIDYSMFEYMAPIGHLSYANHVGIIAFLLFVFSSVLILKNRISRFYLLLLMFVVFLLLSMGPYAGIDFYSLLTTIPGFDRFRVPARILIVGMVPFAIVCGYGIDSVRKRVSFGRVAAGGLVILILAQSFLFSYPFYRTEPLNLPSAQELGILPSDKVVTGAHIYWRRGYAPEYYDIPYVHHNGAHFMHGIMNAQLDWDNLEEQYLKQKAAEALGVNKVITETETRVIGNVEDPVYSTGYNFLIIAPPYDQKIQFLFWDLEINYYEQALLQNIVNFYNISEVTLVSGDDSILTKNKDDLGVFDVIFIYQGSPAMSYLSSVYTGQVVVYGQEFQIVSELSPQDGGLSFSDYERGYSYSTFTVQTSREKQLVVERQPFTSLFSVSVDGKPANLLLVNGVARGFVIDSPGTHRVVIQYNAFSILLGFFFSFITLLASVLYLLSSHYGIPLLKFPTHVMRKIKRPRIRRTKEQAPPQNSQEQYRFQKNESVPSQSVVLPYAAQPNQVRPEREDEQTKE